VPVACGPAAVAALALSGCPDASPVPSENVLDFRVNFDDASATESCTGEISGHADAWEPYSQIYRVHWPDGAPGDGSRTDLWWKEEGDTDESFQYFASGTLTGSLDEGSLQYAGGEFVEERDGATVDYEVEGSARMRFGDQLAAAHEDYVITDSSSQGEYPVGCVFRIEYSGEALSEQGDEAE
jgi:hypothetical protein